MSFLNQLSNIAGEALKGYGQSGPTNPQGSTGQPSSPDQGLGQLIDMFLDKKTPQPQPSPAVPGGGSGVPSGTTGGGSGGGGFDLNSLAGLAGAGDILNSLLGGGGSSGAGTGGPGGVPQGGASQPNLDKGGILSIILEVIRSLAGGSQGSWLDMFANKISNNSQNNSGIMNTIINQFVGNTHDNMLSGLLGKILSQKKQQAPPEQAEQISKVMNQLNSEPDNPEIEQELRAILLPQQQSASTGAAANDDEIVECKTVKYH